MTASSFDFMGIWVVILAAGIMFYVVLDGFDLGVGMLYGFISDSKERDALMNAIAPIWDGNETWLVLGGLALLAAFPLAFAIIVPAIYFPVLTMLLGLVFRGVAFEFRFRELAHRSFWDHGFFAGSLIATLSQGAILGAFIQGFQVEGRVFAGSSWDCFTPFTLLTAVALVAGYGLLGAGWLILKTEGKLQDWARVQGQRCLVGVLIGIAIVSFWTPFTNPAVADRWFVWPNIALLAPIPFATMVVAAYIWRTLKDQSEAAPFAAAIVLFLLCYLGIAISLWPMIVPPNITLREASSSPSTQAFLLVGTLFLLPIIVTYTAWSYWVFRGKVRADVGYH